VPVTEGARELIDHHDEEAALRSIDHDLNSAFDRPQ
jgi:hypothetical protein